MIYCLCFIYVFYCIYFYLAVGLNDIFVINGWRIFSKLFLFVLPVYIFLLYKLEKRLNNYDYFFMFSPMLFWFILICIAGGKSGMNTLIVDLPIVGIISGMYLCKYLVQDNTSTNIINSFKLGIIIYILILILISIIHFLIPYIPE